MLEGSLVNTVVNSLVWLSFSKTKSWGKRRERSRLLTTENALRAPRGQAVEGWGGVGGGVK